MKTIFTAEFYRGENYPLYFRTPHWLQLNEKLIDSNPRAKCWICEIPYNLLIHHESYRYLFHERLYRDVFILCFTCHTQLHFYRFLFIFQRKTKLTAFALKRRRLWLRLIEVTRKKRFGLSFWYFFRYSFCI